LETTTTTKMTNKNDQENNFVLDSNFNGKSFSIEGPEQFKTLTGLPDLNWTVQGLNQRF